MLTENDVIDILCRWLSSHGYEIIQKLNTNQQGDDIIATKNNPNESFLLYIEVKGETSSKKNSERFNKPFTNSQVRVHVSEALFKAAQVISREMKKEANFISCIAFPNTKLHRKYINEIEEILRMLRIPVFWIDMDNVFEIYSKELLV